MKFHPMTCPECGESARGTLEDLTGCATFTEPDAKGEVGYAGYTEVFWDGAMTRKEQGGDVPLVVLLCPRGHEWGAVEVLTPDDPTNPKS
jgi:hypothetical protein